MASYDVPSAASVVATIRPVSSLGMKPFGTPMKSTAVPSRTAAENASAARRWFITHRSVRP